MARFEPLLGQKFTFTIEGIDDSAEAELMEASPLGAGKPNKAARDPFSLVFKLPPSRQLAQHTYQVQHPGIGTVEIFLVPLKSNDEGWWMVATFN